MCIDNKVYLTFDMDWACDEVMDFLYDLLEEYNVSATVNITNGFHSIAKYKTNNKIILGIHPNFNFIVDGYGGVYDKESIIKQCKEVVPDAVVARSHSLLNSTPITKTLRDNGIRYELNCFIVPYEGICVYPWFFQGVLQVPFFYEDDLYLMENNNNSPQYYLGENIRMYKVFNFHPIHLFLNSESLERYYRIKKDYHDFSVLKKNRNISNYGVLDFFKELIMVASNAGYEFEVITNIRKEGNNADCGDRKNTDAFSSNKVIRANRTSGSSNWDLQGSSGIYS